MIVPYQRIDYPNQEPIYRPVVDITILCPGCDPYPTTALIDSGADMSLFAQEILDIQGIDLSQQQPNISHGAGGVELKTIYYPVYAEILGHRFKLETRWQEMDPDRSMNLLGRGDFFMHFKVAFNERNHTMDIEYFSK